MITATMIDPLMRANDAMRSMRGLTILAGSPLIVAITPIEIP
jgi:hypothetical protein